MSDLKPCPFCGGEAVMCGYQDEMLYYVKCRDCGACSDGAQLSAETAAAAWNRRAERTCHPINNGDQDTCSECGELMSSFTLHCPHCGSKVVTEGYDDGRCAVTAKVPRKLGDLIEATEVGLDIVLALAKARK